MEAQISIKLDKSLDSISLCSIAEISDWYYPTIPQATIQYISIGLLIVNNLWNMFICWEIFVCLQLTEKHHHDLEIDSSFNLYTSSLFSSCYSNGFVGFPLVYFDWFSYSLTMYSKCHAPVALGWYLAELDLFWLKVVGLVKSNPI